MLNRTVFRVAVRVLAVLGVFSIFVNLFFLVSFCAVVNIEPRDPSETDTAGYARWVASESRTPQWFPEGGRIAFSHAGGVYVVDSAGSRLELIDGGGSGWDLAYAPSVSPDGSRIAYSAYGRPGWFPWTWAKGKGWGVVTAKADGSDKHRITGNNQLDINPVWSPDGIRIAFVGPREYVISVMRADGSELQSAVNLPVIWSSIAGAPSWSPDGNHIAIAGESGRRGEDIFVVEVGGSNQTRVADGMGDGTSVPAWSPDGRRIAFVKDGSDSGVFTVDPDGAGLRKVASLPIQTVSRTDSISWSPDGSTIQFRGYVVKADGSTERSLAWSDGQTAWSPDGSRIAIYASDRTDIVLYTAGPDGLDRRVLVEQGKDGLVPANGRPLP